MPVDEEHEEPFILVTSKRQKSKNSIPTRRSGPQTNCKQLQNRKGFLHTTEDDDKSFDEIEKATELR